MTSEGTALSLSQWQDFIKSPIWAAILWEIEDRKEVLVESFRENDAWSSEMIRGMLLEHEFIKQIPAALIADIAIREANIREEKENNNEENFADLSKDM